MVFVKGGLALTEGLGRLGEEREFVRVMRRTTTGLRGLLRLRRRLRSLVRGKAREGNQPTFTGHTLSMVMGPHIPALDGMNLPRAPGAPLDGPR